MFGAFFPGAYFIDVYFPPDTDGAAAPSPRLVQFVKLGRMMNP